MTNEEKPFRERIITTADLYSRPKKKKQSKILTTRDLPEVLPIQKGNEESSLRTMVTTKDVKEKKENEEQKS